MRQLAEELQRHVRTTVKSKRKAPPPPGKEAEKAVPAPPEKEAEGIEEIKEADSSQRSQPSMMGSSPSNLEDALKSMLVAMLDTHN